MAGFRDKFIKLASGVGQAIPFEWLMDLSGQNLVLPVYHIISDEDVPHIKNLYPVKSPRKFIEDLDFLLKHFKPIDYFEFEQLVKSDEEPKQPSFLLSFDDGLREFHDVIAPILLKKGVPALCFLNSDFIDNKALFYRYKVSLLIEELSKGGNKAGIAEWFSKHGAGHTDIKSLLLSIKYDQQDILDELAEVLNYSFDEYLLNKQPYLSSEQINSLKAKGFQFGAHSIDHPEYRFLSQEEQLRQTKESMEKVCSQFDLDYKTFAFPFTDHGVKKEFFDKVKGGNVADITFGCAGQKKEQFAGHYQRIPLEMEQLSAKQIMSAEFLYYILRSPLAKNTIARD